MKTVQKFQADDGRLFDTAEECALYEEWPDLFVLAGLDVATLSRAAKEGGDVGAAIERVGRKLAKERIEREGPMRQRAGSNDAQESQQAPEAA